LKRVRHGKIVYVNIKNLSSSQAWRKLLPAKVDFVEKKAKKLDGIIKSLTIFEFIEYEFIN
jgi:hypothetical protein